MTACRRHVSDLSSLLGRSPQTVCMGNTQDTPGNSITVRGSEGIGAARSIAARAVIPCGRRAFDGSPVRRRHDVFNERSGTVIAARGHAEISIRPWEFPRIPSPVEHQAPLSRLVSRFHVPDAKSGSRLTDSGSPLPLLGITGRNSQGQGLTGTGSRDTADLQVLSSLILPNRIHRRLVEYARNGSAV